ncbi:probable transcription initiation factor IIB [Cephalotrichum gorgonifer]|uniref:Transcription initiation factor IIB n=1 Tax=Cephalotrichum gorgonifer TaxID=2041049 RepID=A0AAE8MQE7_9PEZI|nr:probable transcription initiation factor IIB [Cephalotrichum gorgonifer]
MDPSLGNTTRNTNGEGSTEFNEDLNNILMCPDCREYPPNLKEEYSAGDIVCDSCGLVLDNRIVDVRSEWRSFANDDQNGDDPSRVGDSANPLLNGSQLETSIGAADGRQSRNLARLQNNASGQDKTTKTLLQAYKEISTYCDVIHIPKHISETAKHIFKLTEEKKALKGKPQDAIIAGCIFIACRQAGVGRTFREIHMLTKVGKKDIGKVFKLLEAFLQKQKMEDIGVGVASAGGYENTGSTSAESLCARYCSRINFDNTQIIENTSRELAKKTNAVADLAGRSPLSVAAACIYMASHLMGQPKTSREIAQVAGVSDGTIRTAYRFLYQARAELVEPEWLEKGKGNMDNLPMS